MAVYAEDILDLVHHAEELGVKFEVILIPALEFAEFRQSLEQFGIEHPEDMKKLAGLRMVPHYPLVAKYHRHADEMQMCMDFYNAVVLDPQNTEDIVYNYFGIDRTRLAAEQDLLKRNMEVADAISK